MALLLLLSACGGGDDVDTGSGATSGTGTTTGSDTTTPSGTDEPVAFPPWGPNDPPIPGQYAALAVTSADELDCDSVDQQAPASDFWSTVVGVCRALRGDSAWPASRSPDPPPAANGYQDCLNRELATTLDALFAWRDDHPDTEPKVAYPALTARSRCTFRVYDASAFPVSPDSSNPSGGVVVELYVAGLDEDASPPVLVDGERVELRENFSGGGDGLLIGELFIPAPVEAHNATIVVNADFGDVKGSVTLPDVPVSTSTSTPTGPTATTTR